MDVTLAVFNIVAFLVSGIFHEQAHARVALWFGDPAPKAAGRLSWDPTHHVDPIMTFLAPIVSLSLTGGRSIFGMMKPVMIQAQNFENPTLGHAMSALAGPVSNALLALLGFAILGLFLAVAPDFIWDPASQRITFNGLFLCLFIQTNFMLGGFNILPLPALDGSHVLYHFVPASRPILERFGPYAMLVTLFVAFSFPGLLSSVYQLCYNLMGAAFGREFAYVAFTRIWR